MPGSGRCFTTCPGWDAVLRHAQIGAQFYDMPRSGRSFTTCPDRGRSFYDMPGSGRSFTTCPGQYVLEGIGHNNKT